MIVNAPRKPLPQVRVNRGGGEFADLLADLVTELFAGHLVARKSHQREVLGEQLVLGEIVKRRNELALGQVARRPKDHHDARVGGPSGSLTVSFSYDVVCQLHSSPF